MGTPPAGGFVAGPEYSMDWMTGFSGRPGLEGEYVATTGAVLAGRDGFDSAIGDSLPYGDDWQGPILILTHHPVDARPAEGIRFLSCPVAEAVRIGLERPEARTSRCSPRTSGVSCSSSA